MDGSRSQPVSNSGPALRGCYNRHFRVNGVSSEYAWHSAIMKPQLHSPQSRGFALVVTLSLMILLTIIAVGLLTLSSISLRASSQGNSTAVSALVQNWIFRRSKTRQIST